MLMKISVSHDSEYPHLYCFALYPSSLQDQIKWHASGRYAGNTASYLKREELTDLAK